MWEKISDYCLDVSKYFLTAVFVTLLVGDVGDAHWVIYTISGVFGVLFFCLGIYFSKKNKNDDHRKKDKNVRMNFDNKKRKE